MSIRTCFIKIQNYVKESGLEKNVTKDEIRMMARKLEAAGGDALSPAEFHAKAQKLIDENEVREIAARRAEKAQYLYTSEKAVKNSTENAAKWKAEDAAFEAARAQVQGGSLKAGEGTRTSIGGMKDQYRGKFFRILGTEMDRTEGLYKAAQSGQIDGDFYKELWAIAHGLELGKTENPFALEYAKANKVLLDAFSAAKQAISPYLETFKEYMGKQFHDRMKITKAGFDVWFEKADKAFGKESFPEMTPEEKKLAFQDIFNRIKSGTWGSVIGDTDVGNFRGVPGEGGNMARKMGRSKQLIPHDMDAWVDYNKSFGPDTAFEGLAQTIETAARDTAVMMKWSSQPAMAYNRYMNRLADKVTPEQALYLKEGRKKLDRMFMATVSPDAAPARELFGKFTQGVALAEYLGKAGTTVLHALPDIQNAATLVTSSTDGQNVFGTSLELAGMIAKRMAPGGGDIPKARMADLGMTFKTVVREMWRDLGAPPVGIQQKLSSGIARTADAMGMVTMHNRWVNAVRSAVGELLSVRLASMADMAHADLPQQARDGMASFDINEHTWNFLREHALEEIGGRTMMTPEAIKDAPDEAITDFLKAEGLHKGEKPPTKGMLAYGRLQLETRLAGMINEHADQSTIMPNDRQRYFLYRDMGNDGFGAALRLATQFKMAAVAQHDIVKRAYYSGETPGGGMVAVAKHMVGAMFFAALGEAMMNYSAGKNQPDLSDPEEASKFAGKVLIHSGAPGVFGDLLLNELTTQGVDNKLKGVASGLLGPGITDLSHIGADSIQALQESMGAKPDPKLNSDFARTVNGLMPFQNLFYSRAAYAYILSNELHDFLGDSGYLGSLERSAQRHGQEYSVQPIATRNVFDDLGR